LRGWGCWGTTAFACVSIPARMPLLPIASWLLSRHRARQEGVEGYRGLIMPFVDYALGYLLLRTSSAYPQSPCTPNDLILSNLDRHSSISVLLICWSGFLLRLQSVLPYGVEHAYSALPLGFILRRTAAWDVTEKRQTSLATAWSPRPLTSSVIRG
jgi:hypothetical protein